MERIQAFEFHERAECPGFIRESIVEALGNGLRWRGVYDLVAPALADFCARARCAEILDLCSGSGEPAAALLEACDRQGLASPRFVLSDLYPNAAALAQVAARHPRRVEWVGAPVDATEVPEEADRAGRTIVNAFHHFPPPIARRILRDAVVKRRAIFIVEAFPGRDLLGLASVYPGLVAGALASPFLARRDRLLKLLATYVAPVVPVLGTWDALVSNLRVHGERELGAMVRGLGGAYAWQYRELPLAPFGRAVVFSGVPPRGKPRARRPRRARLELRAVTESRPA